MFPIQIKASENPTPNYQEQGVLYRPSEDVIEIAQAAYDAARPKPPRENYGANCVHYVQNLLYGRINLGWGAGGRNLTLDQVPAIGAVVVFTYIHVAYITDIVDGKLILSESNFIHGQITHTRQVAIGDATIRGYYHP